MDAEFGSATPDFLIRSSNHFLHENPDRMLGECSEWERWLHLFSFLFANVRLRFSMKRGKKQGDHPIIRT